MGDPTLDADLITLIWLIAGIVMMVGEVFVPGLVVVFLGAAAVVVSGLRWIGLESVPLSFLLWGMLSTALVLATRSVANRLIKSESHRASVDEDVGALGTEVEVIITCSEEPGAGRIRYQGTSWPAMTVEGTIEAGSKARLLFRNNLAWVVETVGVPGGDRFDKLFEEELAAQGVRDARAEEVEEVEEA